MLVKTIGLIGKPEDSVTGTLLTLYNFLIKRGYTVFIEEHFISFIRDVHLEYCTLSELGERCDLAITIGGDGTLLTAARTLSAHDVPLVGINMGRLGFLVDISSSEMLAKLEQILNGEYVGEERFLLEAKIFRNDRLVRAQNALNEVVVQRWSTTGMVEFDTFVNGVYLNSQRSDGLIVSTPTGSTAYALSGGGPILYPFLDAIVLVPINPHTLSNRPIVVDGNSRVEIAFTQKNPISTQVTCDDISISEIEKTDRIRIEKSSRTVRILHPVGYDFFEILRAKLNWSGGYN